MNEHCPLWSEMERFVAAKRALGYKFQVEALALKALDRFLANRGLNQKELPQHLIEEWTALLPHWRPKTHYNKAAIASQFARHLIQNGIPAYLPAHKIRLKVRGDYVPYIFTKQEIGSLLCAVDQIPGHALSPRRHILAPLIFRLLVCTGMRIREVISLWRNDVDLDCGVITVRDTKFGKDRLVPLSADVTELLRGYVCTVPNGGPEEHFFSTGHGRPLTSAAVYIWFRRALRKAGIAHFGRGRGPRVHDLRHTFAVRRMEEWRRQGENLDVKLPLLSVYLGHLNLFSTQNYLRLTPSIYPEVVESLEQAFGSAIKETEI